MHKKILANTSVCALLNEIPTEETKGMRKAALRNEVYVIPVRRNAFKHVEDISFTNSPSI